METFNKPTYPRPDFARESWESLDGEWEFDLGERFQTAEEALGSDFEEKIQVPFCYQSQASGIGRTEGYGLVPAGIQAEPGAAERQCAASFRRGGL